MLTQSVIRLHSREDALSFVPKIAMAGKTLTTVGLEDCIVDAAGFKRQSCVGNRESKIRVFGRVYVV